MTNTNINDVRGRLVGVDDPTRDDHAATKGYVDAHGSGGSVSVTDGTHTVSGLTELDFTSGATVTDAGGGVAQVAVAGGGSQPVYESGHYDQSGTTTIANNGFANLPFDELLDGDDVLDLTVPGLPAVRKAGLITVQAQVYASPFTAGGACFAQLILDANGAAIAIGNSSTSNGVELGVEVVGSWVMTEGQKIRLRITNEDGVEARDFQLLNAIVTRIGPA